MTALLTRRPPPASWTAVSAPKLGQAIDAEVNRDGTPLIRAPREIEGADHRLVGADWGDLKVLISSTGWRRRRR